MIKCIVCDLDGTLIKKDDTIEERTCQILKKCIENGIEFIIATGRDINMVIDFLRDGMSQPQSESYSAAKGGIHALTHSLAMSLAGKVRVNSISPGWIQTESDQTVYQGADVLQHPVKRIGKVEDIAHMVLFLCSDKASFITGENICIDGGMTKQMIYHGEHGWEYKG